MAKTVSRFSLFLLLFACALLMAQVPSAYADASGSWSSWGSWSDWSTNYASESDSRQVETRQVPVSYDMEVYVCGNSKGVRSYLKYMQSGYTQRAHYTENWPAERVNSVRTVSQGSYWNGASNVAGNVVGPGTGYLDQNQVPFFIVNTRYETQYRYRTRSWIPATYKVSWLGNDNKILGTDSVTYGSMPVYRGATPTKASTAKYSYSFDGWYPSLSAVVGDVSYTAQFKSTLRSYTVKFTDGQGKTLKTQSVAYGSAATAPTAPTRSGYTFAGWNKSFGNITSALTVDATWTKKSSSGGGNSPVVTTQVSIAKAVISGVADAVYTGKAICPSPVVQLGGKTLAKGTDYTVSYANNTKIGTATIVVTGKGTYRGTVKKTFKILPVEVTRVSLDKTKLSLEVGKTATLKGTVAPSNATDKTLAWKSSNTKVATVDANGNVKAVSVGSATITATSKSNGKASATCALTVTKKADATTSGSGSGSLSTPADPVSGTNTTWKRVFGKTALDTMSSILNEGWSSGCGGVVFVATSASFPDALSASGAAGLFNAPILLVGRDALPNQTKAQLLRIKPKRIVVVGGKLAVSDKVLALIKAACGVAPERVSGSCASETAAQLNRKHFGKRSSIAILATRKSFQDALSVSPIAYAKHYPIFLADGANSISKATIDAMRACGIKQLIVVGGDLAISQAVVDKLKSYGIGLFIRLYGKTSYDTSNAIAKWGIAHGMKAEKAGVCTGRKFPDALCGGALCGRNNAVILLVDEGRTVCISDFVKKYCRGIRIGYVFGGELAVPRCMYDALLFYVGHVLDNQNIDLVPKSTLGGSTTAKSATSSRYDVTGDALPDTITVKYTRNNKTYLYDLNIWINGKKALTISQVGMNGTLYARVRLMRLANGAPFVYVRALGSYGSGKDGIYQYKNGKLTLVVNGFLGLKYGVSGGHFTSTEAQGNSIKISSKFASITQGTLSARASIGYSNGKLDTNFGAFNYMYNGGRAQTAESTIDVYSDYKKSKRTTTIGKGTSVRLTDGRIYNGRLMLYAKTVDRSPIGWIDGSDSSVRFKGMVEPAWGQISVE